MSHRDQDPLPSLAGAVWLTRPETQAVFSALGRAGYAARAVGGAVRNALLGLPVTDIDIATPARPEAVIVACHAAGLATVPTGLAHGTVTVVSGSVPHEVTTLRADVETDGRRATVAFTDDWAADASRRDFTMNALSCDADGRVHDPLGGIADLRAGRVRFIGDPDQRIAEDYLRILRFFRFHAVLGAGDLDRPGAAACSRGRAGLGRLSAERVQVELFKLLRGARALDAAHAMGDHGLLAQVLGVAPRPGVLAAAIEAEALLGVAPDWGLRLSALALAIDEDVPALAARLRLSNAMRTDLLVLDQRLQQQFSALTDAAARRLLHQLGCSRFRRRIVGFLAAGVCPDTLAQARRLWALTLSWPVPRLPVKGADVLALGIAPGPDVGAILAEVEAWWVDHDFPAEILVRDQLAAITRRRKG